MRHTDAPGGAGDPPGFRLDDCATQRNLSVKGRADAATIGARLKSEGIAVEKNPQLAVVSLHEHGHAAEAGTGRSRAGARTVIDQWAGSGILLVVTHGANIHALESVPPASGEIRRGTKRKRWPQRTARPPES
jgi:hypothetical protein